MSLVAVENPTPKIQVRGLCKSFGRKTVLQDLDLDAGAETGAGVSHDEVLRVFAANVDRLRGVLFDAVAGLPGEGERDCLCVSALGGMDPGFVLP